MANEELRLAGSALTLRRFTAQDLSSFSQVNHNTARAWIQRNSERLESVAAPTGAGRGRGRPKAVWRLKPDAIGALQTHLDQIQAVIAGKADDVGPQIDDVEAQYETWLAAERTHDPSAAKEFGGLRALIRIGWEDCASLFAAGQPTTSRHLRRLAEIEREAGLGGLPDENLYARARSLALRLKDMHQRDVPDLFAGQTWRIRAEVRSRAERCKFTAAALAAPVWSDEGLADGVDLEPADLLRCTLVADEVPLDDRIDELSQAMDPSDLGLCRSGQEAQALARGLTARPDSLQTPEVLGWLAQLPISNLWTPHLAPIAFHGLADGGRINIQRLLDRHRTDISTAVNQQPADCGRLRREALSYAANALKLPQVQTSESDPDQLSSIAEALRFVPVEASA